MRHPAGSRDRRSGVDRCAQTRDRKGTREVRRDVAEPEETVPPFHQWQTGKEVDEELFDAGGIVPTPATTRTRCSGGGGGNSTECSGSTGAFPRKQEEEDAGSAGAATPQRHARAHTYAHASTDAIGVAATEGGTATTEAARAGAGDRFADAAVDDDAGDECPISADDRRDGEGHASATDLLPDRHVNAAGLPTKKSRTDPGADADQRPGADRRKRQRFGRTWSPTAKTTSAHPETHFEGQSYQRQDAIGDRRGDAATSTPPFRGGRKLSFRPPRLPHRRECGPINERRHFDEGFAAHRASVESIEPTEAWRRGAGAGDGPDPLQSSHPSAVPSSSGNGGSNDVVIILVASGGERNRVRKKLREEDARDDAGNDAGPTGEVIRQKRLK